MPGRVIAIGDIHGCARALEVLIDTIVPTAEDVIVPLGDMVDRGPNSRSTIEQLIALQDRCQLRPILGNHEEMMLDVVVNSAPPQAWIQFGGIDTLDSYGFTGNLNVIPESHISFLQACLAFFETETHFFVHANYNPALPLDQQSPRVLRWLSLNEHLPGAHTSGKVAFVGHTADRTGEVFSLRHLKCIDTFCYGGLWLTAMDVNAGTIWQANEQGMLRKG